MRKFYTVSEAGGVRIGNNDFSILIPNGYGDGITTVHIIDEEESLPESRFFTSFWGEGIKIYAYDSGRAEVMLQISGRFGAYYNNKSVYFVRWE